MSLVLLKSLISPPVDWNFLYNLWVASTLGKLIHNEATPIFVLWTIMLQNLNSQGLIWVKTKPPTHTQPLPIRAKPPTEV